MGSKAIAVTEHENRCPECLHLEISGEIVAAKNRKKLVSLFIRATDLGFLKPLYSKARFFIFDPARKIRDTNVKAVIIFLLDKKRLVKQ
jgi:hypothetical protein